MEPLLTEPAAAVVDHAQARKHATAARRSLGEAPGPALFGTQTSERLLTWRCRDFPLPLRARRGCALMRPLFQEQIAADRRDPACIVGPELCLTHVGSASTWSEKYAEVRDGFITFVAHGQAGPAGALGVPVCGRGLHEAEDPRTERPPCSPYYRRWDKLRLA